MTITASQTRTAGVIRIKGGRAPKPWSNPLNGDFVNPADICREREEALLDLIEEEGSEVNDSSTYFSTIDGDEPVENNEEEARLATNALFAAYPMSYREPATKEVVIVTNGDETEIDVPVGCTVRKAQLDDFTEEWVTLPYCYNSEGVKVFATWCNKSYDRYGIAKRKDIFVAEDQVVTPVSPLQVTTIYQEVWRNGQKEVLKADVHSGLALAWFDRKKHGDLKYALKAKDDYSQSLLDEAAKSSLNAMKLFAAFVTGRNTREQVVATAWNGAIECQTEATHIVRNFLKRLEGIVEQAVNIDPTDSVDYPYSWTDQEGNLVETKIRVNAQAIGVSEEIVSSAWENVITLSMLEDNTDPVKYNVLAAFLNDCCATLIQQGRTLQMFPDSVVREMSKIIIREIRNLPVQETMTFADKEGVEFRLDRWSKPGCKDPRTELTELWNSRIVPQFAALLNERLVKGGQKLMWPDRKGVWRIPAQVSSYMMHFMWKCYSSMISYYRSTSSDYALMIITKAASALLLEKHNRENEMAYLDGEGRSAMRTDRNVYQGMQARMDEVYGA